MADYLQATVRFLHILFGTFWIGAILYQHIVLAVRKRVPPPAGGPVMLALGKRGIPALLGAGILTVVFGLWNQWLIYGALAYQGGTAQVALGAALFATLGLLAIGIFGQIPTFRKLEALAPKGPPPSPPPAGAPAGPPPAVVALQKRMRMFLMLATVLALFVIAMMVLATLARTTPGW